jgi:hypothetical protein
VDFHVRPNIVGFEVSSCGPFSTRLGSLNVSREATKDVFDLSGTVLVKRVRKYATIGRQRRLE